MGNRLGQLIGEDILIGDAEDDSLLLSNQFVKGTSGGTETLLIQQSGTPELRVGEVSGAPQTRVHAGDVQVINGADELRAQVVSDGYVEASPDDGYSAFQVGAGAHANALAALDCADLPIINLPTVDPGVAGALWNNAGTPAISTGM